MSEDDPRPPATKRRRDDEWEEDNPEATREGGEATGGGGGGNAGGVYDHRFIKYSPVQPWRTTIRMRRQCNIKTVNDSSKIMKTFIPYNILEWYGLVNDSDGAIISENKKLQFVMSNSFVGIKYHRSKITLSHLVTFQDELLTVGGTAQETTTFNATPYMYIGIDSNGALQAIKIPDGSVTVQDICKEDLPSYALDNTSETLLKNCATVKTLQPNETWTHTKRWPDFGPWFFSKQNNIPSKINTDTDLHLLPARYPETVTSDFGMFTNDDNNFKNNINYDVPGIFLEMPIARKVDGTIFKFRGNFICECELDLSVYLPPDFLYSKAAANSTIENPIKLSLQTLSATGGATTGNIQRLPYVVRRVP